MAKFSYLAIDRKGKSLPGEIIASNAKEAKKKLRDEGLTPVKLKLLGGATSEKISNKSKRVFGGPKKSSSENRKSTKEKEKKSVLNFLNDY